MTDKILLLTGANGRTGRAIIKAMTARDIPVRAFIRDQAQAGELEALGVRECAVGDLRDPQSIIAAMKGAAKLLHIGPPMHPEEVEITEALLAAATAEKLEHFIYYSVMHPVRRDVRHHRLKLDAEEKVIESGLNYTIVQPGRYMQHFTPLWRGIVEKGVVTMPFSPAQEFSVVDLNDLAEACAIIAASERHYFATYELAGPDLLSHHAIAEMMSTVAGRKVEAAQTSLDALAEKARAAGASEDRITQMIAMNKHYDAYGFRGNGNVLQYLLGRPATRLTSYLKRLNSGEG